MNPGDGVSFDLKGSYGGGIYRRVDFDLEALDSTGTLPVGASMIISTFCELAGSPDSLTGSVRYRKANADSWQIYIMSPADSYDLFAYHNDSLMGTRLGVAGSDSWILIGTTCRSSKFMNGWDFHTSTTPWWPYVEFCLTWQEEPIICLPWPGPGVPFDRMTIKPHGFDTAYSALTKADFRASRIDGFVFDTLGPTLAHGKIHNKGMDYVQSLFGMDSLGRFCSFAEYRALMGSLESFMLDSIGLDTGRVGREADSLLFGLMNAGCFDVRYGETLFGMPCLTDSNCQFTTALLVGRGLVSTPLKQVLDQVGLAASDSQVTLDSMVASAVNALDLKWSATERAVAEHFADVLVHSSWRNGGHAGDYYTEKEKAKWVVINDGIGGILGLIGDGVGSVLCATAFSYFTVDEVYSVAVHESVPMGDLTPEAVDSSGLDLMSRKLRVFSAHESGTSCGATVAFDTGALFASWSCDMDHPTGSGSVPPGASVVVRFFGEVNGVPGQPVCALRRQQVGRDTWSLAVQGLGDTFLLRAYRRDTLVDTIPDVVGSGEWIDAGLTTPHGVVGWPYLKIDWDIVWLPSPGPLCIPSLTWKEPWPWWYSAEPTYGINKLEFVPKRMPTDPIRLTSAAIAASGIAEVDIPAMTVHYGVGMQTSKMDQLLSDMRLYPNPAAHDVAVLQYTLPGSGQACLTICDVLGRIVATQGLVAGRRGNVSLDLHALAAGVYLVRLTSADLTISKKLVVQR